MTMRDTRNVVDIETDPRWLSVVGIGDDGWSGLGVVAQRLIDDAEFLVGGARHLAMIPEGLQERQAWQGDFSQAVAGLTDLCGRRVVVLASGDPMHYGVGALIVRKFPRDAVRVVPHIPTVSHVCARMLWSHVNVTEVSLCGRPIARLLAALGDRRKVVALSADGATPAHVAAYLRDAGYGQSVMHVFAHLGGCDETCESLRAVDMATSRTFATLNVIAIECVADAGVVPLPVVPGLPDDALTNDGQMTKRDVRAITLMRLSPQPGQLLWDIGLGSGSIAIEWLRAAPGTRAIGLEKNPVRAERARGNADRLGVAGLEIVEGQAGDLLDDLAPPDAIFIGGGLSTDGIIADCWAALRPGGRLVANVVSLESEALLLSAFQTYGGDLTRIGIERADPVGTMTGWRPGMTVMQWAVVKPRQATGDEVGS